MGAGFHYSVVRGVEMERNRGFSGGRDGFDGFDGCVCDAADEVGDLLCRIDLAEVAEVVRTHEVACCLSHCVDVQITICCEHAGGFGGDGLRQECGIREEIFVHTFFAGEAGGEVWWCRGTPS